MANPFKEIMNIRKEELPLALLMYAYFFLVITSFWILKPLKKGLFITFYDQSGFTLLDWHLRASQAELLAKILNMFVAFLAVVVFSILARRFRRQQLTIIFCMFFMACYVLYSFVINQPNGLAVWSFYLFGDLFSTLMVATFFVFLNDSVTPSAAFLHKLCHDALRVKGRSARAASDDCARVRGFYRFSHSVGWQPAEHG